MQIVLSTEQNELPILAEQQTVEFACLAPANTQLALQINGQILEAFLRPGDPHWYWRWNTGNAVGTHQIQLDLQPNNQPTQQRNWSLQVQTSKLSQQHYQQLLSDLNQQAYQLWFRLSGISSAGVRLVPELPEHPDALERYYALFEGRFANFVQAVQRIANGLAYQRLRPHVRRTRLGEARQINGPDLADLPRSQLEPVPAHVAHELQTALRPQGGLLPRDLPNPDQQISHDTYEHRLLKQLLQNLSRRARHTAQLAQNDLQRSSLSAQQRLRLEQIAQGCTAADQQLRQLHDLPFLQDLPGLNAYRGATPLFQRDPNYREIYRMWQAQRQTPQLSFDSPLFYLPIRDLPQLYESWCVLMLAQALVSLADQVLEQRFFTVQHTQQQLATVVLQLREQAPMLKLRYRDATLTLRYHPYYQPDKQQAWHSLDRFTHIPDCTIEIERPNQTPKLLVFDAKYRVANGQTLPPDALSDAYTYLGAIAYAQQRAVIGSFICYPAQTANERYAADLGVLSLLPDHPNATNMLNRVLLEYIHS